jgi:hypothetical protein
VAGATVVAGWVKATTGWFVCIGAGAEADIGAGTDAAAGGDAVRTACAGGEVRGSADGGDNVTGEVGWVAARPAD